MESGFRQVVPGATADAFRLVNQDGVSGQNLHMVIPWPGIYPDGLLHRGTNRDGVVSAECINQNGKEFTLARQERLYDFELV